MFLSKDGWLVTISAVPSGDESSTTWAEIRIGSSSIASNIWLILAASLNVGIITSGLYIFFDLFVSVDTGVIELFTWFIKYYIEKAINYCHIQNKIKANFKLSLRYKCKKTQQVGKKDLN